MTGDALSLLLLAIGIACLFLTPAASLPSKIGNSKTIRDIAHTNIKRLILNTIETVGTQTLSRPYDEDKEGILWDNENAPTLPDVIKSLAERRHHLAGTNLLRDLKGEDDTDIIDKRNNPNYGMGLMFGKQSSWTQSQRQQSYNVQSKTYNDQYGWGNLFGKRDNPNYGWGLMFGKRNGEEEEYDDFVAL